MGENCVSPWALLELPHTRFSGSFSLSMSLKFSLLPIAKVLIMCGLGFLMSTRHIGVLSNSGTKLLSKLVFALFLPCLIFTGLGTAITFEKMLKWWFIPVNIVLAYMIDCLIGLLVVLIVRPPHQYTKFTIAMIGVGNIGNIPLVVIGAVCDADNNPFGDSDTCNELGVAYIAFGQWVGAVLVYTFVYSMLAPVSDLDIDHGGKPNVECQTSLTIPLCTNGQSHEYDRSPFAGDISTCKSKASKLMRALEMKRLKHIFQPPVIASILALVVGATPALKNLLLADDAPLLFISDSLTIMGEAMIPCIMLALGGNLVGGPGSSKLGVRTTIAITFSRLFLTPPAGIGIVAMADKLGFLPENDQLFRFVLLLQHTMPTSLLAGAVTALQGFAEKEASSILFWEHILAAVSITAWLILYLNILF